MLEVPSLVFERGKIYALIGKNGTGKTTLLRSMNGFMKPRRGSVVFMGENLYAVSKNRLTEVRRRMTLVSQKTVMFDASVYYNVAYGLRARGLAIDAIEPRVAAALASVGLDGFENRRARQISGGEARRVALARALALDLDALLLDEPTGSVDVDNTEIIEDIIKNSASTGNTTVIFSTHSRRQAERLADVCVMMTNGHPGQPPKPLPLAPAP